ncbi:MAG: VOC family protein [Chitinophagaceae bacterium]|nr:MAG: VOC family protein [Chitinophagaceae bacterium]
MLTDINPKIPMRNKEFTRTFYVEQLGFELYGADSYDEYLMLKKDNIQIHFFRFETLDPAQNYGQVYIRTTDIEALFSTYAEKNLIHPNGTLQTRPWGQKEFALLDPDNNLLTFGQAL